MSEFALLGYRSLWIFMGDSKNGPSGSMWKQMSLLPCWVYVCSVIVWISRLLRGGQANVGNIFEPSPNWLLNVQFTGQFGEGGSQVTAPSVGCNKYACLKHNFFPLSQYSASNRDSRQDLQVATGGRSLWPGHCRTNALNIATLGHPWWSCAHLLVHDLKDLHVPFCFAFIFPPGILVNELDNV